MGGEISMEDEDIQLFDEKEFEKQWQKNGMGNESMWSFFSSSYQQIVDTILRPMAEQGRPGRLLYDPLHDLGPAEVDVWPDGGLKAVRQDHTMTCYGGKKIVFSIWRIQDVNGGSNAPRPFVVYLHSAVGARPEALQALHTSLRAGANFAALDFEGSGLSEGEIVTWGYYENNDVVDVVRHLLKLGTTTRIALWGRQLGAATAMSYASRDPRVACLILDTPYSSLDDQIDVSGRCNVTKGMHSLFAYIITLFVFPFRVRPLLSLSLFLSLFPRTFSTDGCGTSSKRRHECTRYRIESSKNNVAKKCP